MPSVSTCLFEPGTLLAMVKACTDHAVRLGAIQTIPTRFETFEDGGVHFLIRIVSNLIKKAQMKVGQHRTREDAGVPPNPFLPFDKELFVADISPTHVCLLNKFNVLDHHILMITRTFQEQESLLTHQDFEAVLVCLAEFEGLVFYNAGQVAGASQRHRHWQMVPLPIAAEVPRIPIEPLLGEARFEGGIGIMPGFHFRHVLTRMNHHWMTSPSQSAHVLRHQYKTMLEMVGLSHGGATGQKVAPGPYNLLVTRKWMLLVPRSTECVDGISINALGYAGGLLIKNEPQLNLLKTIGPMTVLQRVALPL